MRTVKGQPGNPILEAIKEHGTWFTISMIGLVLIFGITLVNDPSKWWIGLTVALGLSVFLFTAANGRVVLKAIGSIFVLLLTVAGAASMGALVSTVPLFGLSWPTMQLSVYLLALALSYMIYSGRGRWTYLGLMAAAQFGLTALMVIINTEPHLSMFVGAFIAFIGFLAAYLLNGRTRVAKTMPESGFSKEFLEAVVSGAEDLNLNIRVIPAKGSIDTHILIFGEKATILYPIKLDQAFSAVGKRGNRLGYKTKDINPWLLKLSFFTSPSWKARGASPSLVLVDTKTRNGAQGKIIGISLPDSKKKAVVGVQPAPAVRLDRESYGRKLILNSQKLMEDYSVKLTEKQKVALSKVGLAKDDILEFSTSSDENNQEENKASTKAQSKNSTAPTDESSPKDSNSNK